MSIAFGEHSLFSLPVDGFSSIYCKVKGNHTLEEDTTTVSDPSFNSIDAGKEINEHSDPNSLLTTPISTFHTPILSIDQHISKFKKNLLLNTSINVFYHCYRAETDKLDEYCLSSMIINSIDSSSK